jgi:hypothetical protein
MMAKYRGDLLPVAALLLLGSFAYLHLTALPAFEDEGSQLRWIYRVIDAGEWLAPLGDGKPLEAWPMVPLIELGLPPLTAVRAVHVAAGMISVLLTYALALQLGGRWTACACGALFALCPFAVYLERLALSDMLLCAAGAWVLLNAVKFIALQTWNRAAMLALSFMLAAFCKFPVGFVFLITLPLALLLMPSDARAGLLQRPALTKLLLAHAPVVLLGMLVMSVAIGRVHGGRLPGFGLQDLMGIGLAGYPDIAAVIGVAHINLLDELAAQLSWPVVLIGLTGIVAGAFLNDWRQHWLIAAGAVPMLGISLLAQFWFSRYLLFTLPPLIIGATFGWRSLCARARALRPLVEFAVFAICAGLMGRQSALLILDPPAARWSPVDRFQYIEGWSSGYGYPQAAGFLIEARDTPSMIYSLDGHSAYQLRSYLPAQWAGRIGPIFYGPEGKLLGTEEERWANLSRSAAPWIIVPEELLQGDLQAQFGRNAGEITLRRIAVFDKPGLRTRLALYEAIPRQTGGP